MKKMLVLLLAAMMCVALVACGNSSQGGLTPTDNNSQTNNEENGDPSDVNATLDAAYLAGVWVRHEKDKELERSLLSFELNADKTGTVNLSENGEVKPFPIIEWRINEIQSVVELHIDTDANNIANTIYFLCTCPECGALTDAFAAEPCFVKETE